MQIVKYEDIKNLRIVFLQMERSFLLRSLRHFRLDSFDYFVVEKISSI